MKRLFTILFLAAGLVSCSEEVKNDEPSVDPVVTPSDDDRDEPLENGFSVTKDKWGLVATKSATDSMDVAWKIGEEVTVFSEDGAYHNFNVATCDDMYATFDCDSSFWEEGHKYLVFYPSLAEGWLEDGGFVLTFSFLPENANQKVADWFKSDWVTAGNDGQMHFKLKHLSSRMTLKFSHPHNGQLSQCYIRVPSVDDESTVDRDELDIFGYKIAYIFNSEDFVLDSESKTAFFPLCFDKRSFEQGEEMVSTTPMYSGNFSGRSYNLILVYSDNKVYYATMELPNMEDGNQYIVNLSSEFTELDKEPSRWMSW